MWQTGISFFEYRYTVWALYIVFANCPPQWRVTHDSDTQVICHSILYMSLIVYHSQNKSSKSSLFGIFFDYQYFAYILHEWTYYTTIPLFLHSSLYTVVLCSSKKCTMLAKLCNVSEIKWAWHVALRYWAKEKQKLEYVQGIWKKKKLLQPTSVSI